MIKMEIKIILEVILTLVIFWLYVFGGAITVYMILEKLETKYDSK